MYLEKFKKELEDKNFINLILFETPTVALKKIKNIFTDYDISLHYIPIETEDIDPAGNVIFKDRYEFYFKKNGRSYKVCIEGAKAEISVTDYLELYNLK